MRKILAGVTGTVAAIVLMVVPVTGASALGVHSGSNPGGVHPACMYCGIAR